MRCITLHCTAPYRATQHCTIAIDSSPVVWEALVAPGSGPTTLPHFWCHCLVSPQDTMRHHSATNVALTGLFHPRILLPQPQYYNCGGHCSVSPQDTARHYGGATTVFSTDWVHHKTPVCSTSGGQWSVGQDLVCLVKQICGGNIGGWVGQVLRPKHSRFGTKGGEGVARVRGGEGEECGSSLLLLQ